MASTSARTGAGRDRAGAGLLNPLQDLGVIEQQQNIVRIASHFFAVPDQRFLRLVEHQICRRKRQPVRGVLVGACPQNAQQRFQLLPAAGINQEPQGWCCDLWVERVDGQSPSVVPPGFLGLGHPLEMLCTQHQKPRILLKSFQLLHLELLVEPRLALGISDFCIDTQSLQQIFNIPVASIGLEGQLRRGARMPLANQVDQTAPIPRRCGRTRCVTPIGHFGRIVLHQFPRRITEQTPEFLSIFRHIPAVRQQQGISPSTNVMGRPVMCAR